MKKIEPKDLIHLSDNVGKEKAIEIHKDITQGILMALFSGQDINNSNSLIIPVSQETAQVFE